MLPIARTNRFKRDYKKYQKDEGLKDILKDVVDNLANEKLLPAKCRDHQLRGDLSMYRECHITPDVLLIYKIENLTLFLVRLGSHSELF